MSRSGKTKRTLEDVAAFQAAHPTAQVLVVAHTSAFFKHLKDLGESIGVDLSRVRFASARQSLLPAIRGHRGFGLFVDHAVADHPKSPDFWDCMKEARSRAHTSEKP